MAIEPIGRFVDAVDDLLEAHVHRRFAADEPDDEREWGLDGDRTAPAERRRARARRLRLRDELRHARDELRRAVAGVLFLRNKLEAEQTERRVRMARTCHALLRAAREGDDETALPLLAHRDLLRRSLCAAEEELAGLRTQAADGKAALARLARALERLERRPRPRPGRRAQPTRRR